MSNRVVAFIVALEEPTHEEDAEAIAAAIRQLRGVARVSPKVANYAYWSAREATRFELIEQLRGVLYPGL